jgi:hypothetical protein
LVVLRSYLLPVLEGIDSAHIRDTIDGFCVKGPDYELNVDERQLSLTYKDAQVDIALSKMGRTIMCYEIKNESSAEQLRLLGASRTDMAKEVMANLDGGTTALAFSENLEDTVRLVGEHLKYRSEKRISCSK